MKRRQIQGVLGIGTWKIRRLAVLACNLTGTELEVRFHSSRNLVNRFGSRQFKDVLRFVMSQGSIFVQALYDYMRTHTDEVRTERAYCFRV